MKEVRQIEVIHPRELKECPNCNYLLRYRTSDMVEEIAIIEKIAQGNNQTSLCCDWCFDDCDKYEVYKNQSIVCPTCKCKIFVGKVKIKDLYSIHDIYDFLNNLRKEN